MKIILCGALGKMGAEITRLIEQSDDTISASVDIAAESGSGIFRSLNDVSADAEVLIDFSFHGAAERICEYVTSRALPAVIATTGHTEHELAVIKNAAERVPIFLCSNMAPGVALICDFVRRASIFYPNADIEIVETHRRGKLDAPSGTALMLAREMTGNGRIGSIGIHSLRLGNTVGEHTVIICADGETLTVTHRADKRMIFARGALAAARFIINMPAGLYDMRSLIKTEET